jgi:hypothetical protein
LALLALPLGAQVPAEPVLRGQVLLDEGAEVEGTVVLHRVSNDFQGEVDSVRTGVDGSFSFRLPNVPDPQRGDVFFASIRYSGILYFGTAVTLPVQLDSLYRIQVYDTVSVAPEGRLLPIQARNTFLEPGDGDWLVTDLLQIRNDARRTLVAREGGVVWQYPLPAGSRDHRVGQGGLAGDGVGFDGDDLVVRSALPPGPRLVVVHYTVDDPFMEIPAPGVTEVMELLVREPAPELAVPGLTAVDRVELEPGSTYRRFSGDSISDGVLRLEEVAPPTRVPVEWVSVLLALVLTGFGVAAVSRTAPRPAPTAPVGGDSRRSLLLEVARMDEAFEALGDPSEAERTAYRRRRRELLRRLQDHT